LLVEVLPTRVSRVIGKKGQVADFLRETFDVELLIGRNGRIIIMGKNADQEVAAAYVIQRLCAQPYVEDPLEEVKKLVQQVSG